MKAKLVPYTHSYMNSLLCSDKLAKCLPRKLRGVHAEWAWMIWPIVTAIYGNLQWITVEVIAFLYVHNLRRVLYVYVWYKSRAIFAADVSAYNSTDF